jgi:hypothetical protein
MTMCWSRSVFLLLFMEMMFRPNQKYHRSFRHTRVLDLYRRDEWVCAENLFSKEDFCSSDLNSSLSQIGQNELKGWVPSACCNRYVLISGYLILK